ncbi:MAG: hypothetical protein NC452_06470 [Eubacterium sp.]|nr:hypothetical protein [Eubacterium sp.]
MKKYLVDIYLPPSGEHYNAYLPANKKIGEATVLLVKIMESLSKGDYKGTTNSVLINAVNGEVYNRGTTVYDAGIRNSSKLILI